MKRRQALWTATMLLGGTVVGAEAFLSGCKRSPAKKGLFGQGDIALLDEVGETILPATASSPGAKAAHIGAFMKTIVTDCYNEAEQKAFVDGLDKLGIFSKGKYHKGFMGLSPGQRHTLLAALDREAREHGKTQKAAGGVPHYFRMMKQLTLWGYFTSEIGCTQAMRYVAVPGKFEGCVPYHKGDKAWAAFDRHAAMT